MPNGSWQQFHHALKRHLPTTWSTIEYPAPSPLSSPQLSTHTIASIDLTTSDQLDNEIEVANLCPYCDQEMPSTKSEILVKMGKELEKKSWADPLDDNPGHHRTAVFQDFIDFCAWHTFESKHLPRSCAAGWPTSPNFTQLFNCVHQHRNPLWIILANIESNEFFSAAKMFYAPGPSCLQGITGQYAGSRTDGAG